MLTPITFSATVRGTKSTVPHIREYTDMCTTVRMLSDLSKKRKEQIKDEQWELTQYNLSFFIKEHREFSNLNPRQFGTAAANAAVALMHIVVLNAMLPPAYWLKQKAKK